MLLKLSGVYRVREVKSEHSVEQLNLSLSVNLQRQWHLKHNIDKLKMDSVITPFWKNVPPYFLGLSEHAG